MPKIIKETKIYINCRIDANCVELKLALVSLKQKFTDWMMCYFCGALKISFFIENALPKKIIQQNLSQEIILEMESKIEVR